MSGINGAGPSNFFWRWRADDEPVTERERDSSSGANLTNSPQLRPESPTVSGRRLLRSNALSRQTREWQETTSASAERGTPPVEPRQPPEAQPAERIVAERIVQELVRAGANLNSVRTMLRNVMDNNAVAFSRVEWNILLQHFPDMHTNGISSDSVLANELRQTLRQVVHQQRTQRALAPILSPAPSRPVASSSRSSQRTLLGRFTGWMAPRQTSSSSQATSSTSVDRHPQDLNQLESLRLADAERRNRSANQTDTDEALRRLTQAGVDMERLSTSLGRYIHSFQPAPPDLRRVLESVGIDPDIPEELTLVNNPVLNLNVALNRMLASRQATTESSSVFPSRAGDTRVRTLPVMPEREDNENNVAYGVRLLRLNPEAEVERVVEAFITDPSSRPEVVADIHAVLRSITSQFRQLRTISKADAESQDFRDAADYPDDPTSCLFGEDLSLSNPHQQVIGLAGESTDILQPYSQEGNKALRFMDMKKLAEHLASKPVHPMNRDRLDDKNIAGYAFRVVPD
ncbi:Effector protein hopAB1 [Pseudomonas sp. KUIN-1]|uniref:Effector protein hopAB1 n=2 Tax=Pseudomonas TaxID=286 RepID=UPI0012608B40